MRKQDKRRRTISKDPSNHEVDRQVRQSGKSRKWLLTIILLCLGVLVAWWGVPRWQLRRAEQAMESRRFGDAARILESYPWWGADAARGQFMMARIARLQSAYARSQNALRTAKLGGYDPSAIARERVLLDAQEGIIDSDSIAKLQQFVRDAPEDQAAIFEAFAIGYLNIGQPEQAIRILDRWITDQPADSRALYWKGSALKSIEKWQDASQMFLQATRLSPEMLDAYLATAEIHQESGRTDKAIDAYRLALQVDSENVEARVGLARMLWLNRRRKEAFEVLKPYLQDRDAVYLARRLAAQYYVEEAEPGRVIEILVTLLEEFPESAGLNHLIARAYHDLGDSEKSEQAMMRFFTANEKLRLLQHIEVSNDAPSLLRFAAQLRPLDWSRERKWLELAVSADPQSPQAHALLARNLREGGEISEATREQNISESIRMLLNR